MVGEYSVLTSAGVLYALQIICYFLRPIQHTRAVILWSVVLGAASILYV